MRLAERAGQREHRGQGLTVANPNAAVKAAGVIAWMLACADSIDDLDVLPHGGMGRVFTGVRAPSTFGTFLLSFTFGHVRQLDAVQSKTLAGLARATWFPPIRGGFGYAASRAGGTTLKYAPVFPEAFGSLADARAF